MTKKSIESFMWHRFISLVLLFIISPSILASSIAVSQMIVNFMPTQSYRDLIVENRGQTTAYVNTQLIRIDHPGMPDEKHIQMLNNPNSFGLVVSPRKLIIPKGQVRTLRLLPLIKDPKKDVVYKIVIAPAHGALTYITDKKHLGIAEGVQVIVAYGVKVFLRPGVLRPKLMIKRQGKLLTLINKGNTNILLNHFKQCKKSHCTIITGNSVRLYAGNHWQLQLPYSKPVTLTENVVNRQMVLHSN